MLEYLSKPIESHATVYIYENQISMLENHTDELKHIGHNHTNESKIVVKCWEVLGTPTKNNSKRNVQTPRDIV